MDRRVAAVVEEAGTIYSTTSGGIEREGVRVEVKVCGEITVLRHDHSGACGGRVVHFISTPSDEGKTRAW